MSALQDFKSFITKGDVIQIAVGIVIGLAFTAVVTALVSDVITPLIGVAGHYNFAAIQVTVRGSTFLFGAFLNSLISFVLIALTVFFLIVRPVAAMDARAKAKRGIPSPTTRECPECLSQIPLKAKRCSYCTSMVTPID